MVGENNDRLSTLNDWSVALEQRFKEIQDNVGFLMDWQKKTRPDSKNGHS